jgi:hypothetical protein
VGLVIRGPRYELHLTSFWKCLACADFIKDLIWRVQLLNAEVFIIYTSLAFFVPKLEPSFPKQSQIVIKIIMVYTITHLINSMVTQRLLH